MRILVPPLHTRIQKDEPFTGDVYGRLPLAQNLTRLLKASEDGLVITLEGGWGSGKTTFLRMWEASLALEPDLIPVYYNSFSHDFTEDPFVSLAATIYDSLSSRSGRRETQRASRAQLSHLKDASRRLAVDLAQMTAGLAVTSLTSGVVGPGAARAWIKRAFDRLTFDTLKVNADAKFEAFIRSEDSIGTFQKSLIEILTDGGERDTKVVVLVDELDRCRPVFAVELLENVKHLFNTPGVIFVLGVNPDQLIATIQRVYGIPEDASKVYLEKFVDLSTTLPIPERQRTEQDDRHILSLLTELAELLGLTGAPTSLREELPLLSELVGPRQLDLSPRAIEKTMSYVSLGLKSCSPGEANRLKKSVSVAAAVRVGLPDLYAKFKETGGFWDDRNSRVNLFAWAKTVFKSELEQKAANVFVVDSVREAARLLDMYEIPEAQDVRFAVEEVFEQ